MNNAKIIDKARATLSLLDVDLSQSANNNELAVKFTKAYNAIIDLEELVKSEEKLIT